MISIVIPSYNEAENIRVISLKVSEQLKNAGPYEIIFVDDGSTDKTLENCLKLKPLKLILFRKNFGQTAAIDAGIKGSVGELIVTMDADLQNDPRDIPRLIAKLEKEKLDVVYPVF